MVLNVWCSQAVLLYQPISVPHFKAFAKQKGVKVSTNALVDFFDAMVGRKHWNYVVLYEFLFRLLLTLKCIIYIKIKKKAMPSLTSSMRWWGQQIWNKVQI